MEKERTTAKTTNVSPQIAAPYKATSKRLEKFFKPSPIITMRDNGKDFRATHKQQYNYK
jgi:hypothetical protein